ncbi:hypothetical protein QGN23_03760 [Chryseobacterium gotjawalense]|uniref:DUF4760 domain-containing protein n=1 Tax=Chryseobacterium gotjawalense TaxID=3042315 RepID=A0ABY8RH80_9FLAO|nr:hypothetical protein [Chryseobacterium sp. wdc7]WHF52402.1 hypothetical protein QGN23_03760 [Chryseobacterium sp. wdc7]
MKEFLNYYVIPLGVISTFIVGVYNIYIIRKNLKSTKFIETITTERIKWLNILREEISEIISIISDSLIFYNKGVSSIVEEDPNENSAFNRKYNDSMHNLDTNTSELLSYKNKIDYSEVIKKLYILKLRFNPSEDSETLSYVQYFIEFYNKEYKSADDLIEAKNKIDLFVKNIQLLLKKEWEKVKRETKM